ncbi:helix-turn-helix domain-containing protein [Glaciecola sp. 1036]|uniref:helix-turn-helix domain-containing protein n=1 Tax=Alteromonadaceae TaxID=72275 RepID=UPI003CFCD56A
MDSTQQLNEQIAHQLKLQRKQKGWSLDRTAKETGVSKAMLGQIERQESSPTIATLWKIATGLNCSFSSFIATHQASSAMTDNTPTAADFTEDPNMAVLTLFPFNPITKSEIFEITLTHFHEQESSAHQLGVLEHIHVIEGKLNILQGDIWHEVNANEQFLLKADQPHSYKDEAGLTKFIDVIFYPS